MHEYATHFIPICIYNLLILTHVLQTSESGVFREVADLEEKGRLKFQVQRQFQTSIDTLVRAGDHVLVDTDVNMKILVALDFSQKGKYQRVILYSVLSNNNT